MDGSKILRRRVQIPQPQVPAAEEREPEREREPELEPERERARGVRPAKGTCTPREKVNPEPCQPCLTVPEIRKTEPSHNEVPWEKGCPVHHCPIAASPSLVRDHLPSSSCMLGPISTQANGQVPSSSQDSHQHHLYYHCNQQEPRGSYALPPLPGHGERATLCSHHSSGDPLPAPHHENPEGHWKQWSHDQHQSRTVQHHIVTVRHDKGFRMPKSYSQVIAEWPVAVLVLCSVTVVICTLAGLLVGNLPDFAEPLMKRVIPSWYLCPQLLEAYGTCKLFSPCVKLNRRRSALTFILKISVNVLKPMNAAPVGLWRLSQSSDNGVSSTITQIQPVVFANKKSSLMISYFLYKVAFQFTYFPFVNLTAVIILSSICANHTFVFFDLWSLNKSQNPSAGLLQWMRQTMHHFGYLMLTSCFTTGAAFYASYMSNIIAIRCFAIYMGTSVLVNLIFMMTWLPSSIVLYERYIATNCIYKPEDYWNNSGHKRVILFLHHIFRGLQNTWCETSKLLFEKLLPCGVIKFRYIWICWFAALAIGGAYISCFNPKLKLPTLETPSVQVFRLSHPFERYDAEYCHQFMFERLEHGEGQHMPITIVWGILPVDNGDHFNPKSNGTLVVDTTFTIQKPEAQKWLLEFCQNVKNQTFYYPDLEQKSTVCFMEEFLRWMDSRQCSQRDHSFNLCCNHFTFPYRSEVFLHCIKIMIMEQGRGEDETYDLGLRFDGEGNLAAMALQFQTIYHYSFNYSEAKQFYNEIELWITEEMKTAPVGLQNGWFTSKLELYNLQNSLSTETMVVMGLSIAISFVVLLLTTWNVLLSIFSVMAITGTVLVTVGLLVLLEWQLNAVESLFISAAVGLSIDFTVNYCISYHLCPHSDRLSRVAFSLKQMSCATAMAASALFSAGIIMLPATVLAYRKLGIFIMMIKCISCGFASFFFQSLCCFFGPEKNCGQILWPCAHAFKDYSDDARLNGSFACGRSENPNRLRKVQESNTANEQYELQPLARKLSDSFDNSTSTSKLSNRPSVLSEDMQLEDSRCPKMGIHPSLERDRQNTQEPLENQQVGLCQCPALQTSSPYKHSSSGAEAEIHRERLCRDCRCQKYGPKAWDASVRDRHPANMKNEGQLNKPQCSGDAAQQQSDYTSENSNLPAAEIYKLHRCLCSPGSNFDMLNISSETSISDSEQSIKLTESASSCPDVLEISDPCSQTERGHLNGKRDTLRLDLKETVFDISPPASQQNSSSWKNRLGLGSEGLVVLPNSQPDMPDVWIRRSSVQNSS
ncbi:PREDICTED: protein dispatched homolog 2 [Gavialis gangeticus]|uniref:protein dispatched homolog 2 n=1 Tax=Gavialis gangeticus TaxID=94835 RepID=UPI00092E36A9|nr:PREDICTED: protein dispatched homolog 2 [Gavialis gangeticus]